MTLKDEVRVGKQVLAEFQDPEDGWLGICNEMDREAEEPTIEETYLDINDHYLYENKWDETTGKHLDPKLVMAGRTKELTRCAERAVWEAMPRDEAMKLKDVKYVKTRWVETMKDGEVRSRFVAQEFAAGDPRTDLFAGPPPTVCCQVGRVTSCLEQVG